MVGKRWGQSLYSSEERRFGCKASCIVWLDNSLMTDVYNDTNQLRNSMMRTVTHNVAITLILRIHSKAMETGACSLPFTIHSVVVICLTATVKFWRREWCRTLHSRCHNISRLSTSKPWFRTSNTAVDTRRHTRHCHHGQWEIDSCIGGNRFEEEEEEAIG